MAVPPETLWELDPHTKAKHEILRRYLKAWFPILNSWNNKIVYIDGFAGPGRYKGGEIGSPLIALDAAVNHRRAMSGELVFWFIDERKDRIAHLQQELKAVSIPNHFRVTAEAGTFHEKLGRVLDDMEAKGSGLAPTFAFIDPFGFSNIPFSLIERLLKHPRCEVLVTFMVDAINRFLEHPHDKLVQHIVDAFGTDEAIEIAKTPQRIEGLRALYQSRLQAVADYVRYFEMRDRQDRTQYYLFFATNHALGHLKMKEAMWRVDPDGDFRFSDATNPNQLVLFEADPTSVVIDKLRAEFGGKGYVAGREIKVFIENKTAFLKKHMTVALKQEEVAGRITVEPKKLDGNQRRAKTYPDDAQISFV